MAITWPPATSAAARIAAATPPDRDRVVDAVRVTSLLVVVLGHWLMADVRVVGGAVRASNVLDQLPRLHALTWLLQVVPLFFIAGGFANATVWRRTRGCGGYLTYLRVRMSRLLVPVLLFALLAQGILCLLWLAVPAGMLGQTARAWGQPLWFLAVYIVVTALAPVMHRWHARAPVSGLVVPAMVVAVADLARLVTGTGAVAYANFLVVWLFAQQLGFWYADGRLAQLGRGFLRAAMLAVAVALIVLTSLGPYPTSMVGVAGEMSNMNPPTLCLVLLAVAQAVLLVLVRPHLVAWLERRRVWAGVVSVGAVAMTLYLWHLVALAAVVGIAALLDVELPGGGTVGWWLTRPLWLAALATVLLVIAWPVSRLERSLTPGRRRRAQRPLAPPTVAALAGLALAAVGVAGYATRGLEPFGLPYPGIPPSLLPNSGCLLLGWFLLAGPSRPGRRGSPVAQPRYRRCRPPAPAAK